MIAKYHGSLVCALTSTEYLKLICRFDVDKKKADAISYVARGFNVTPESLKGRGTMTGKRFMANLSRGVLHRG